MKEVYKGYLTNEKGLSSTSANYIANLGKEYIVELEQKLEYIVCYNTRMSLLSTNTQKPIQTSIGIKDEDLVKFNDILTKIADIKSLCAWLREAIKAKDEISKEITRVTAAEYVKKYHNDDLDKYNTYRYDYPQAEFNRSILEQATYLKNETYAAVYGQFIHKNNPFNTARQKYYEIINKPFNIEGDGQDRIIVSYTPSVSAEMLESTYMQLQHTWREYEARLNKQKYDTEQENMRLKIETEAHIAENAKIYKEYVSKYNTWKLEELNKISKLKIFIPEIFEQTYMFLESLGKQNND